jgi:hypothetical protein
MPNFSVVYFLQMAGFLRNLANFSFQASGMRVTELLVNSAELSVNSAELSVNMAEFWFFKKISVPFAHPMDFGRILAIFSKFFEIQRDGHLRFFCSARIFKP